MPRKTWYQCIYNLSTGNVIKRKTWVTVVKWHHSYNCMLYECMHNTVRLSTLHYFTILSVEISMCMHIISKYWKTVTAQRINLFLRWLCGSINCLAYRFIQISHISLWAYRNVIRHLRTNWQWSRLREREKPHLGPLRNQMNCEPKHLLVPCVVKARSWSSQSFDFEACKESSVR